MSKTPSSEITPEYVYLSRRKFMVGVGALAGSLVLGACVPGMQKLTGSGATAGSSNTAAAGQAAPDGTPPVAGATTDELGASLNTFDEITHYNNYYEFSEEKEAPAELAKNFITRPWTVQVGGLVNNPKTYDVDELIRKFAPAEHIYRLRCVEAWSMVIPWVGFSLGKLLREAQPTSAAKYVRFEALKDPQQMPGQRSDYFPWPYVEGLRVDEAMHDLTLLATGLYGKPLPLQDGAPLRLVVPWKYGFKSIKAIVKIDLVEQMPNSLWMQAGPDEYGFYANVNPKVPHPRWSQATERRIGTLKRMETLMFNGYSDQVASLYAGMDLRANF